MSVCPAEAPVCAAEAPVCAAEAPVCPAEAPVCAAEAPVCAAEAPEGQTSMATATARSNHPMLIRLPRLAGYKFPRRSVSST